jgi:protein O-mannosyl-transferase
MKNSPVQLEPAARRDRPMPKPNRPVKAKVASLPAATAAPQRLPRHALLLGALLLLAFFAYSNSFAGPFLVDNEEAVLQDTRVHAVTADHLREILAGPYRQDIPAGLYRPLVKLSFLFNYAVLGNGENSFGYHVLNFGLHAVNIALVYALGIILFESIPPAWLLAALWAVHPLLTESVTNLVGRADMLAAFGVLAPLLAYIRAMRTSGRRRIAWFVAAALAAAVGLFSKESAIVAIAVLLLYDLSLAPPTSWRARLPGYAAVAIPALAFLAVRAAVLARFAQATFPFVDNPLIGEGFWTARLTAVKVIGYDLALLLWPARLSCDYSYNQIPAFAWRFATVDDAKALLALAVCIAAVVVAIRFRRTAPPVFFGIGWFFITLSPTSNLVLIIGSIMAERFLYLSSVGFLICVVYGFDALWRRQPRYHQALAALAAVLLLAASIRTYNRNADWSDLRRLWTSAEEAAPGSYRPHMVLSGAVTADAWQSAAFELDRALAILNPLPDSRNVSGAWREAGTLYRKIGDLATGAAGAPSDPASWYRKSLDALLRSQRIETELGDLYRRLNPGRPDRIYRGAAVYADLGRTYMRLSDPARALAEFEKARAIESDPDLLEDLAGLYRGQSDFHAAAAALIEALAVDPSRTRLGGPLVDLYSAVDPSGCAVTRSAAGPELNVNCPLVHADICTASRNVAGHYEDRGQTTEAASIRRTAVNELGCAPDVLR